MDSTGPIFQPDRHDRMEIIITKNANLVVERLRYTEFFFILQYFYLVIMNADDIEIDIERFIYEIQIRREFGIRRIGHMLIKRRYIHSSKQEKHQDLLADRHKRWQTVLFQSDLLVLDESNTNKFASFLLCVLYLPEMESSRTSLAWRIHFEVLGFGLEGQVLDLGLEASNPRKLPCPRLEDSTIFWVVKSLRSAWKIFWKTFFSGDRLKIFSEDFFLESTCACVLGLGLEHSSPWTRGGLSSVGLSLASDFFLCPWPCP